jgi:hypothetical protein
MLFNFSTDNYWGIKWICVIHGREGNPGYSVCDSWLICWYPNQRMEFSISPTVRVAVQCKVASDLHLSTALLIHFLFIICVSISWTLEPIIWSCIYVFHIHVHHAFHASPPHLDMQLRYWFAAFSFKMDLFLCTLILWCFLLFISVRARVLEVNSGKIFERKDRATYWSIPQKSTIGKLLI